MVESKRFKNEIKWGFLFLYIIVLRIGSVREKLVIVWGVLERGGNLLVFFEIFFGGVGIMRRKVKFDLVGRSVGLSFNFLFSLIVRK